MTKNKPKPITNTTREAEESPLAFFAEAAMHSASGENPSRAIEAQEARGQREVVEAGGTRLPVEGTIEDWRPGGDEPSSREVLEGFGFVFGDIVENDKLWVEATMPEGWKIVPTNHSMWSDVIDDKGRRRAGLFYKAAFYDRKCHFHINRRFEASYDLVDQEDYRSPKYGIVRDCDEVIQKLGPFENTDDNSAYRQAIYAAETWLNKHYSDWKDRGAYWD